MPGKARSGWRRMVQVLQEVRGEDGEPYFGPIRPMALRRDERSWPAVVWARTGGDPVGAFEGAAPRTEMLLSFLAPTFLAAEEAREKALEALQLANLLAGTPDAPEDDYEELIDEGREAGGEDELFRGRDSGVYAVMQTVMIR